jgi:cytoskeleton protein RodZ
MDRVDERPSGDWLRRERTRRRLTLAQVAQATRIRERYLAAIENDSFDQLPHPVSTIGFIQIYARFLGLDPEPFVRAYKAQVGGTLPAGVLPEAPGQTYVPRRTPSFVVPGLFAVLLVALVAYLYQQVAAYVSGASMALPTSSAGIALTIPTPLPTVPPLPPTPTPAPPTPTPVPTAPPDTPTPVQVATSTPVPSPTPQSGVRIDTEISGRVWLQVEADGKVVFSGILMPGDKRTWTASKSLMLWSGNAGNVQVTYNGKSLGALGPFGKVVKVTWTAPA